MAESGGCRDPANTSLANSWNQGVAAYPDKYWDAISFHHYPQQSTGAFTPVLAKHSKSLNLLDSISVGVDRMQRNFEPMQKQVELWRQSELTDVTAKMIIYQAFIESELEVPRHLGRRVHDLYFNPQYDEFKPQTLARVSNATGVAGPSQRYFFSSSGTCFLAFSTLGIATSWTYRSVGCRLQ